MGRSFGITKKPTACAPSSMMQLSKAALADLAWSLAGRCAESCDDRAEVLRIVVAEWNTIAAARGDALWRER